VQFRRHSREYIIKLKILLDSLMLWIRCLPTAAASSEDQSDFCHNIKCPKILLTEADNAAISYASLSLLLDLDYRLASALVQIKNYMTARCHGSPLAEIRRRR
jgi:hypothetical protein